MSDGPPFPFPAGQPRFPSGPPAPPPPLPPALPPPATPPTRPRRAIWLLAIVPAALLLLAGGVLVVWGTLLADDGPNYPDEWDPRIADIAEFVEDERDLAWKHPVHVEFLPEDEFVEVVTGDDGEISGEDREAMEKEAAELRALGLVTGELDLFEESDQILGEAAAAYYDPHDEVIRIRGDELTPGVQVTVAHELNHALQDQHFDIEATRDRLDADSQLAYRVIVEGDSVNVQHAYADDELSSSEYDEYVEESSSDAEEVDLEEASDALVAWFSAPYYIGPPFVGIVDDVDGTDAIDEMLREGPPPEAAILNPSRFFDGLEPEPVDAPSTPEGAEVTQEGTFGALAWYLVLSSRLDPIDALEVIDGWAGDSYVTYEEDGGDVCVAARFRGESTRVTSEIADQLEDWAEAMPGERAAVEEVDDNTVELRSCDPGPDAEGQQLNDLEDAIEIVSGRILLADQLGAEGFDFDDSWCIADETIKVVPVEVIFGEAGESLPSDVEDAIIEAVYGCTTGG